MGAHVLLFGWKRSIPGREKVSAAHFDELVKYLGGLQQKGMVQGFDVVFLNSHGGDLNGFFLIKGESSKLDALVASTEWETHMARASIHLEGVAAVRGVAGDEVAKRMAIWASAIPS